MEQILEIIHGCIEKERLQDGLLSNVNEVISVYNNEYGVETPGIWIVQHPVTPTDESNLGKILKIKSTIEFVCIEYDPSPLIAEKLARELAGNILLSIKRNYLHIQKDKFNERVITKVNLHSLNPVDEMEVQNKRETVPVTSIILEFESDVNWGPCCK